MINKNLNTAFRGIVFCVSGLFLAQGAHSQTLEEIIVTAQKREQGLQDVPISASAVSGDSILEQGLTRLEDIGATQPSVFIAESFTGQQLFVRGVGTGVSNVSFEQSVAQFVDGVYSGRGRSSLVQFLDIESVEILRGPQPTYFGQNAIAGALNTRTRGPGNQFEGYVNASWDVEFDNKSIDAAFGGPISDTFGARIAARWNDDDGYGRDTVSGEPVNAREGEAVRVSFEWTPSDVWTISGKWEETSIDQDSFLLETINCNPGVSTPCNAAQDLELDVEYELNQLQATGGTVAFPGIPDFTGLPEIFDNQSRATDSSSGHLTFEYDGGGYLVTAITGLNEYEGESWFDLDATPLAGFQVGVAEEYEQFSQELRIQSTDAETIDWMAGVYYQDAELFTDSRQYIGVAGGNTGGIQYNEDAEWMSAFGAITYNVSDALSIDFGVRWSDVEKTATNQSHTAGLIDPVEGVGDFVTVDDTCLATPNTLNAGTCANAGFADDDVNGSIGINWFATEETMVYAKYATGFKAGGLNVGMSVPQRLQDYRYDSEEVDAIELGFKSTLMEGRLELNAALFSSDYSNLQVSTFDPTAGTTGEFNVGNAAEATSEGLEISGRFAATEALMLTYSATWLNAEYDDFPGAQCNLQEINAGVCDADGTTNRAGEKIEFAADFEASVGAEYVVPLNSDFELMLSGNAFYSDGYGLSTTYDQRLVQGSYERIDLRATMLSADGVWSASLFGNNITDSIVYNQVGPTVLNDEAFTASSARGAHWGIQARYNF